MQFLANLFHLMDTNINSQDAEGYLLVTRESRDYYAI
jgi:hypothetical protein